jgi:hypothetical protein
MEKLYKNSWLYGGSIIFPEKITITNKNITWEKKCGFLGLFKEQITVARSHIYSVGSVEKIIGGTINIKFRGANSFDTFLITGQHFGITEINEMKKVLI